MRILTILLQFALSLLNAMLFTNEILHESYFLATGNLFVSIFCFSFGVIAVVRDIE